MPKVFIQNLDTEIITDGGKSLLQIFRDNGVSLNSICNGNGLCRKCLVKIINKNGAKTEELACRYILGDDDLTVITPVINEALTEALISVDTGVSSQTDINNQELLGLAIDLGTTGVSAALLSLGSGNVLETASFLNPQFEYGGDVMTRLSYCMEDPDNVWKLQSLIIKKLNLIIDSFTKKGHNTGRIYKITLAGNTVMQHIFAGVNPKSLAQSPYRPVFTKTLDLKLNFSKVKLSVNEQAIITLLPSVSGFIGGDITAGVFSSGFYRENRTSLFIDIGTNGEIVLKKDQNFLCASAAAGPALEGMNISCGKRAENGAIERCFMQDDGSIGISVIGKRTPSGICGSGLIDLIAVLLNQGIINPSGRISQDKFVLSKGVFLTQKDVRQVQLAKGAIAAGIKILLAKAGIDYNQIKAIYIAGSFGYHLSEESIKTIGLIDPDYKGEIIFTGNSSLEGAKMALVNKDVPGQIEEIKARMETLELADDPAFQDAFIGELNFSG